MQHSFMIRIFNKLETEGKFLNLIKNNYKTSTAEIKLSGKELVTFLLRPGASKDVPSLSPLLLHFIPGNLTNPVR